MDPRTRRTLCELNRRCYREGAPAFDAARQQPWPGWHRLVDAIGWPAGPVLDVGCGNGRFAEFLDASGAAAHAYVGIDASGPLLRRARARLPEGPHRTWLEFDLEAGALPSVAAVGSFQLVVLFGILHHIPGSEQRRRLFLEASRRVKVGGYLAVTFWQLHQSPRIRRLRVPWSEHPGIDPGRLEPGDELLRFGGDLRRYCHFCSAAEVAALLHASGLEEVTRFLADGHDGQLNEYLLLRCPSPADPAAADDSGRGSGRTPAALPGPAPSPAGPARKPPGQGVARRRRTGP